MGKDEKGLLKVAEQAVRMAGAFISLMSVDQLVTFKKGSKDVVTSYDLESQRLIINEISMYFPHHEIFAEEKDFTKSAGKDQIRWFVDPLDGTRAFLRGNVAFVCLSVAAVDHNENILAAAILNPYTNLLYSARQGEDAMVNGKPIPHPEGDQDITKAHILLDFSSKLEPALQKKLSVADLSGDLGRVFRFSGSIAQHLCLIAQGTLDGGVWWGTGTKGAYWDIAAAILICEQAGVKVTDFKGNPVTAKSTVFDQLIVGPPELHKALINYRRKVVEEAKRKRWIFF